MALEILRSLLASSAGHVVDTVIFAAADEDQAIFRSSWRRVVQALAGQPSGRLTTLYASSNDWALDFSEKRHEGPRAGSGGVARMLMLEHVESIDASSLRADTLGHSYFFEHSKAVDDAAKIIANQTSADGRGLARRMSGNRAYWILND
jgi:esterase/lipase superfamily enzyme